MEDKKVLLSVQDLVVKFNVRGRVLTAIRNISLDVYENESIAIVGESGSGKSVFTKSFAGMLDDNGFIDNGDIVFDDEELADTRVPLTDAAKSKIQEIARALDASSKYEFGAEVYKEILTEEALDRARTGLSDEESGEIEEQIKDLHYQRTEAFNLKQTIDPGKEKERLKEVSRNIKELDEQIKALKEQREETKKRHQKEASEDTAYIAAHNQKMEDLKKRHSELCAQEITAETKERNKILAKEIWMSVSKAGFFKQGRQTKELLAAFEKAMKMGVNLSDEEECNAVFDTVTFRVKYLDETANELHGNCIMNLAKLKTPKVWSQIRGKKIATVFQDPMTSLNPIITIGKQITSIIIKHQKCSEVEARTRALELMKKVGIPNAENRFDDYPFQYSGGMRQRIVIAIALSCQPKILICDEPTTALDVTIQAQILRLIKDLQKEFKYTIVFITHDLGVVANIADRVAVLYAGQLVELGLVDEVFYDPRHPYTWALLSSLPQLAQRNTTLYSISGTPPSLYNKIVGDPFAPRNAYCLKVDTLKEPPMFKVTDTHYAKTWLLDPRAPKTNKPEAIENIHEKLMAAFNI